MAHPLMPKATAVWLVENTALTFDQIAAFCGLHELEVQAIADGEVAVGMQGLDPIAGGELTQDELDRCAADPEARLKMAKPDIPQPKARSKGARYTPVSKRQDRPDAIAWLLRNHPELSDGQISKLIGTTKPTINAIRERSHWNMPNIKPQNPVGLGLCAAADLEKVVTVARARAHTVHESKAKPLDGAEAPSEAPADAPAAPAPSAAPDPAAEPAPEPIPEAVPEPPAGAGAPAEPAPPTPDVLKEAEEIFAPSAKTAEAPSEPAETEENKPGPAKTAEAPAEPAETEENGPDPATTAVAPAKPAEDAASEPDAEPQAEPGPDEDAAKSS